MNNARNHLVNVHWRGVTSWQGDNYGRSYTEWRADDIIECGGMAVATKWQKFHGTHLIGGGVMWRFVVSDGERIYQSELYITDDHPLARSVRRDADHIVVQMVDRLSRTFDSDSKFVTTINEIRCVPA